MTTHRLYITGLDCPNCAAGLVQSLKLMPQVRTAELDFSTAVLRVAGDLDDAMLTSKIRELGYDVREDTQPQAKTGFWRFAWQRRDSRLAIIGGVMIVLALMMRVLNVPSMMTKPILLGAMLVALLPIARSGLRDLWTQRNMTINLLMTIAAIGAVAIGDWLEAATVIVLFALGETLEGYTSDRARNSVRQLLDVAPNTALVVRGDQRMTLPASEIKIDDIMLVPAGERIALDGVVVAGTSSVNQAPITGESVPVSKTVGDQVWAGSVVGEQALQIRVTAISSDSVISRIVRLVEDVQQQKANSQRMVDRFARWY
nr:cation-translocating P-type ATPase [Herpetosiphon sp.]